MQVSETSLPGVLLIEPKVFSDERGWFFESWKREAYQKHSIDAVFNQANVSQSQAGVVRGLHYQHPEPQGKLVYVLQGEVFDVAVDIRSDSPTFGQWTGANLSAENHHQLWLPEGFAHGFQVLSETAVFCYFCTRPYRAEFDAAIAFDDPEIGIDWPLAANGLSAKDQAAPRLADIAKDRLPQINS